MNELPNMDSWEMLFVDFNLITFDCESAGSAGGWAVVESGALAIADGRIAWMGLASGLPSTFPGDLKVEKGEGKYLSPGLIDCHTHLVFAGQRADEWQMRLEGKSYEEIAQAGGGILSTVRATRAASEEELYQRAARRAWQLIRQGVTCIEIKSGYGLDVETEIKILRVAQRLGQSLPVTVCPTLLGAHAVPPEFTGRADEYVDLVVGEMIPAARGLATAVDVFTEGIGFSLKQTERIFTAAKEAGFAIKNHAEQLSCLGGARLAAEMGALSSDHLEYLDVAGVNAMAEHGTVATLLPGAFYFLKEKTPPPVDLLRKKGVPMAVATDWNPGSSPAHSLLLMANMACTFFGLTPVEAIRGMTGNGAKALGLEKEMGKLAVGFRADLAIWDIESPAELAFGIGQNPCAGVIQNGERVAI